jgi:hypothetical protein
MTTHFSPPFDDEYEGLSSTFARACRIADEQQRRRLAAQKPASTSYRVPESTVDAVAYLLREGDSQRLNKFLAGRSATECAAIMDQIERRKS